MDPKEYSRVCVVLLVVLSHQRKTDEQPKSSGKISYLDRSWNLVGTAGHLFEHLFEILRPPSDWQFGNLDSGVVDLLHDTADLVLVGLSPLDGPLPSSDTEPCENGRIHSP